MRRPPPVTISLGESNTITTRLRLRVYILKRFYLLKTITRARVRTKRTDIIVRCVWGNAALKNRINRRHFSDPYPIICGQRVSCVGGREKRKTSLVSLTNWVAVRPDISVLSPMFGSLCSETKVSRLKPRIANVALLPDTIENETVCSSTCYTFLYD